MLLGPKRGQNQNVGRTLSQHLGQQPGRYTRTPQIPLKIIKPQHTPLLTRHDSRQQLCTHRGQGTGKRIIGTQRTNRLIGQTRLARGRLPDEQHEATTPDRGVHLTVHVTGDIWREPPFHVTCTQSLRGVNAHRQRITYIPHPGQSHTTPRAIEDRSHLLPLHSDAINTSRYPRNRQHQHSSERCGDSRSRLLRKPKPAHHTHKTRRASQPDVGHPQTNPMNSHATQTPKPPHQLPTRQTQMNTASPASAVDTNNTLPARGGAHSNNRATNPYDITRRRQAPTPFPPGKGTQAHPHPQSCRQA